MATQGHWREPAALKLLGVTRKMLTVCISVDLLRAGRLDLCSVHPLVPGVPWEPAAPSLTTTSCAAGHSHSPANRGPPTLAQLPGLKAKGLPYASNLPGSGNLTLPTVRPRLCSLNILNLQLWSKESSVPRLTEERPPSIPPMLKEASIHDNKLYQPSNKNQNISPFPRWAYRQVGQTRFISQTSHLALPCPCRPYPPAESAWAVLRHHFQWDFLSFRWLLFCAAVFSPVGGTSFKREASSLSRLLFHHWFLLPPQSPLNAWSPKTPITFCSPQKDLLSVPHSPAVHFLPDYLTNKRVFPPPLYQYSEKENKIPSGGLNLFPLIPSQKKRETNALIYSCPRQNRKIHLQIPAKVIYTYILMPFLINNSQVKQHGFWLVFIKKVYPFNNNDKKSAQFIEKLYCTGLWTRLGITHHLQHYFSDTGNSRFPVWEKLEQCNPLMIPYTHSQVIKQKVIPPVWKYLRFP